MKRRMPGLDVIRAVSAVMILLYHYSDRYNTHEVFHQYRGDWAFRFSWGSVAVIAFFFLSGYLMERTLHSQPKPLDFLKKRAVRIYPVFWVAVLLTTAVMAILYPDAVRSVKDIVLNFTMLPSLLKAQPVDGVYWTMQHELFFYIIVGMILIVCRMTKKNISRLLVLLWTVWSIAAWFIAQRFDHAIESLLRIVTVAEYAGVFVLGIALCGIFRDKKQPAVWATLALAVISCFLWQGLDRLAFLAVTALVVVYINLRPQSFLNTENGFTRVCTWVAAISYPLYLTHQYIGYAIINRLMHWGLTHEVILLIPIALSIGIAWLLHRFVEVPVDNLLNKKAKT